MRRLMAAVAAAALAATGAAAQVTDPIPARVVKRGLAVELRDVARLPDSRGLREQDNSPVSWARVNAVREIADGRRFANDMRGLLYVIDGGNQVSLYADVAAAFPLGFYRSLQSGFHNFTFHPDFARNGLFYTLHGERAQDNPGTPHFIPPGYTAADLTYHTVLTEWRAADPSANVFTGTRREVLRIGHVVQNYFHPMGELAFDPTARPGTPEYGLLYTSGSDMGFSNGGGRNASNPAQTQRLDTLIGAVLRIDPRSPGVTGGTRGVGDYTVPAINKFAADNDPKTLGEIFAYGFRNVHRLSWDTEDRTMFGGEIGMSHIEEVNIIREGLNYGWMRREGPFDNGVNIPGGNLDQVYPIADDILDGRTTDGFVYPVAMYDHGEGNSITAVYSYRGRIPALRGKVLFGDILRGRLFAADLAAIKAADDGIPRTVAPIEEVQFYVRENGVRRDVTLQQLIQQRMGGAAPVRADLQLSMGRDGEIYVTTRQDGMIRAIAAAENNEPAATARSQP